MADLEAARAEINKVVSLLVNRFGHEEDVFRHLTLALSHLREPPLPRPIVPEVDATVNVATVTDTGGDESWTENVTQEAQVEETLPEPAPPITRRSRRKRGRR